jgi:type I restriction enzyme S subunit
MSKIDNLIKQLCPKGVEYKKIGDICVVKKGTQLNKNSLNEEGIYPVINGGINPSGYWNEYNFDANQITISQGGASAGYVNYLTTKFWAGAHCYVICDCSNSINYKYLYHFIKMQQSSFMQSQYGAGIPSLSLKVINDLSIPVPPLHIQEEIVRILDKMVEQQQTIEKLIELRKKQYEYYREELLKPKEGWVTKTLGEIFELRNGYTPSKNNPEFWGNGDIPWYRMEDIRDRGRILSDSLQHITSKAIKGKGLFKENSFILATTATIGEHALLIADSLANQQFTNLSIRKSLETDIDVMFIYYYMFIVDEFCKEHTNVSGFESVDMNALKNMEISYPSVKEQEEIANALDKFESCISELTQTLEVCKKRYTHYRDELLRF